MWPEHNQDKGNMPEKVCFVKQGGALEQTPANIFLVENMHMSMGGYSA